MSKTYIAAIATLISAFGILGEADALNFVNAIWLIATTLFTLYGRYQAGGITPLGARK